MGNTTVKIGESKIFVDEFGQLCEAVHIPYEIFKKHKNEIVAIDTKYITFEPINGLKGVLGSIHFNLLP